MLQLSKNYLNPYTLPLDLAFNAKNLRELYLVHTNLPLKYVAPFQAPSLEIIDISYNDCSEMKMQLFMFALKLWIFLASNTNLSFDGSFKYGTLFRGVKNLCKVDLSRNSLTYLPPIMFEDQKNSLSTVNIDFNLFSTIPVSNLKKTYPIVFTSK